MVEVTMKDGSQVWGITTKGVSNKSAEGVRRGLTVLDEDGTARELDLLDVWLVERCEPTDTMRAILKARGMLRQ